jgi:hypothetical protein
VLLSGVALCRSLRTDSTRRPRMVYLVCDCNLQFNPIYHLSGLSWNSVPLTRKRPLFSFICASISIDSIRCHRVSFSYRHPNILLYQIHLAQIPRDSDRARARFRDRFRSRRLEIAEWIPTWGICEQLLSNVYVAMITRSVTFQFLLKFNHHAMGWRGAGCSWSQCTVRGKRGGLFSRMQPMEPLVGFPGCTSAGFSNGLEFHDRVHHCQGGIHLG